jgi:hypothetical protein
MGPKPFQLYQPRGERWCFTITVGAGGVDGKLAKRAENPEAVHDIVGEEDAEQTWYKHDQGFVHFIKRKTRNQVNDRFVDATH